jgi:molecular chaperone GrpE (heat shock protein)
VEKMKPELGEIMGNIQAHHAKLYYSANSKNWKLSEFQLDEIKEGIEEATELHDHFKKVKASLKEISKVTIDPILQIDNAIKQKNVAQFTVAFNDLTRACNHCHQTAEHPFIAIQIPTSQMFSNQKFTTENPQ